MGTFGPTYVVGLDSARIKGQMRRVFDLAFGRIWWTLSEIHRETGDPEGSISAQLRHLKKARFGSYVLEKRRRGDPARGLWEYRLLAPKQLGQTSLF